jgi:hypothetical protein
MTTPNTTSAAPSPIQMSRPTVSYTTGLPHTNVQWEWWSSKSPARHRASYTPTQDDWAKRAPPAIQALAAEMPELVGYWSDEQIEADALAHMADVYGFTNVVIVDPVLPQPVVAVAKTTLEKAAEKVPVAPAAAA